MAIRVTANGLRNIIRSVILEESQRRNSQRRLQESRRRRRAYRLYEGFKNNFEDNLNNYNPDAQELADIEAARARSAALGQFKKPAQKAITHKDFSPYHHDYSQYMEDYELEYSGNPPSGDKNAVGSVAKLYDMVMDINSEEALAQIEDFDSFESMIGNAYDEIHYYISKQSPAIDQVMSDIKVIAQRLNELQDTMTDFDDAADLSDHIDSAERLYTYFAGDKRW